MKLSHEKDEILKKNELKLQVSSLQDEIVDRSQQQYVNTSSGTGSGSPIKKNFSPTSTTITKHSSPSGRRSRGLLPHSDGSPQESMTAPKST